MAEAPYIPEYKNVAVEILVNGTNNGLHTLLKKLKVNYELNKIPSAKLHLVASNPDNTTQENTLQSNSLSVTDEIEIKINTGTAIETLFKGIVYRVESNAEPTTGFEIKVDCKDIAVKLTSQQDVDNDKTFTDKMDHFLQNIAMPNNVELKTWGNEKINKTTQVTPWDYIVTHLDNLGLMTTISQGNFTALNTTEQPEETKYLAQNGVNIIEFNSTQEDSVSNVEIRYWNPETQAVETKDSSTEVDNAEGNEVLDLSQSNYAPETIEQMAKARAAKNRLATTKGKVKTYGNLKASYGNYIAFDKVNPNIDGLKLLIRTANHTIENGCWHTEYNFGLDNNKSFAQNIGQTNNIQGLQIGVVTKIEDDLDNQFRIQVRIPSISDTAEGIWARLSSFQAGNKRGAFFIPEVNDEVILGCINNNLDTPIILGKLYSSANPMPFPIEADNTIQGIVSKENTKFIINDSDKSVEISTDKGNKLLISDAEKGFALEDENGNKLLMNSDGITLESAKDIILKAKSNIEVEGLSNTIKATANMELTGQLIKLN